MAEPDDAPEAPQLQFRRWNDPAIRAVTAAAVASGIGQFGVVAALGSVARTFGHAAPSGSIAAQAGLSGTELGVGLAIIRLASLAGLPLAGLADRYGRRRLILATVSLGLALTALTALTPGYWWFVAVFALGRPLLSATNALTQIIAGEETGSPDRAKAVALVSAGYGVGAGITAILHSLFAGALGFRGLFAIAVVPLVLVGLLRRSLVESQRYEISAAGSQHPLPVLGAVGGRLGRFSVLIAVTFLISVITGPANTFVFLFAQSFVHLSGGATALMVVGAGVAGLAGLLVGRYLADHVGRRATAAVGMVGLAAWGAVAYSGSRAGLVLGYILGVLAGSVLAPAVGALVNELFPTEIRASVAGWVVASGVLGAVAGLLVFGAVADVGNRFGYAAVVVFLPAALGAGLFFLLPESRGLEPEDLLSSSRPARVPAPPGEPATGERTAAVPARPPWRAPRRRRPESDDRPQAPPLR